MKVVCEKLFEAAHYSESNSGDTSYRDEIVAFLESIPEGKQVVDAYYGPQEQDEERGQVL
jgi:hypothetical protein